MMNQRYICLWILMALVATNVEFGATLVQLAPGFGKLSDMIKNMHMRSTIMPRIRRSVNGPPLEGEACDTEEAQRAYCQCISGIASEFEPSDAFHVKCRILNQTKDLIFACFNHEVEVHPGCEQLRDFYVNTVTDMLAPIEEACTGVRADLSCMEEVFSPMFDACYAEIETIYELDDCRAMRRGIRETRKCINNVGKGDPRWTRGCEVLRDMILGGLRPTWNELRKQC